MLLFQANPVCWRPFSVFQFPTGILSSVGMNYLYLLTLPFSSFWQVRNKHLFSDDSLYYYLLIGQRLFTHLSWFSSKSTRNSPSGNKIIFRVYSLTNLFISAALAPKFSKLWKVLEASTDFIWVQKQHSFKDLWWRGLNHQPSDDNPLCLSECGLLHLHTDTQVYTYRRIPFIYTLL